MTTTKLILLDTTLRDGELSPSFNPTAGERLEIAQALELAGVDVIELTSTTDGTGHQQSSKTIARSLKNTTICCLSPMSQQDVEIAKGLIEGTSHSRIHLYLDAKRVHSIKAQEADKQAILALVNSTVKMARDFAPEVEFSPQDATRTDIASLAALTSVAFSAGAQIINISDTTGTSTPEHIESLIQGLYETVPELSNAVLSLHGHNHLGRATDNAMSAICHGVRQIEGTINGVGPAGGNTDLLDVTLMLKSEASQLDVKVNADINRLQILSNDSCFRNRSGDN